MIAAAIRRTSQRAAIILASFGLAATAFGELLEFRTAVGSDAPVGSTGTATFTSVAASGLADDPAGIPARAFAGGFFTQQIRFASPEVLDNPNGEDGVLAGFTRDFAAAAWVTDWLLQILSDGGTARINDLALAPTGEIFVTGVFLNDCTFPIPPPRNDITFLTVPVEPAQGFVAVADPFGNWLSAFQVPGMLPRSIAIGEDGDIYLTGRGSLARRYDQIGNERWSVPEPPETVSLRQIAIPPGPGTRGLYVLGSINGNPVAGEVDEDVFVVQLDQQTGGVGWSTLVGGTRSEEHPGGLGVGPLGGIRVSFSSDNSANVTIDGVDLQELPTIPGRHSHLLFLAPDGSPVRDNLLGNSLAPGGVMETTDLAIDYAGNAHIAVNFAGPFGFESVPHGGQEDSAVITVDAAGVAFRFTDTTGPARATGNAVAAPGRDLQILVGDLLGGDDEQFGDILLPGSPDGRALFAVIEAAPDQEAYILVGKLNEPVFLMEQRITQRGGEVYRGVDLPAEGIRFVSAFLTPQQVQDLEGAFTIFTDAAIVPNGTETNSGWALEALNSAPTAGTGPYSYTYPEPCQATYLYLIDSAIDNSSGHFDGNPNLTFGIEKLVRSVGDPLTSSKFDHGTAMLSMIAGPDTGVAQATPITVNSYDIYPDGSTARLSALVEAIGLANTDKSANHPFDPAVYCVASSATDPSVFSPALEPAVDYTIGSSVQATLVVSAGNTTGLAEDYTPSSLGSKSGVICAGAIKIDNTQLASTRSGSAVDVWAPGDTVDAIDPSGSAITTSGTSASTAYTTGAALLYLSGNPTALPADLETALVTTYSQSDTIGNIVKVPGTGIPGFTTFADWTGWHLLTDTTDSGNDDGDRWTNGEEYVWGFDPRSWDHEGSVVSLSYDPGTTTLTFSFPLACYLYQPSVLTSYTLRDGTTLTVERSSDLDTWTDITSAITLVANGHADGQVNLSFDYEVTTSPCFFRVCVQ